MPQTATTKSGVVGAPAREVRGLERDPGTVVLVDVEREERVLGQLLGAERRRRRQEDDQVRDPFRHRSRPTRGSRVILHAVAVDGDPALRTGSERSDI